MPMLQSITIELQHNRNFPYFIMDNSSEVKPVTAELGDVTSTSNLTQTSSDTEKELLKEEIVDIHYSGTKTEPNVYEREFLYMPSTSFVINSHANIKTEMSEPLIKTECEKDEFLLDPLDVNNMKGNNEEHFDKKYIINQTEDGKCIVTINDIKISENQKPQQNKRNTHVCKKRKHRCDLCNSMFRQKSDLVNHLRIHSGERPFTCEICQKSFNQKSNLHNHMIIHTDQKTHVCDICTKVFRHKANLKEHRLFHSGEKPYLCDICDKSFTRNPDLIKHKRVHTGERPYSCELCSRSFTQSSALQTHKKRLHKDL